MDEPFVLLGYMAALTRIGLATGVVVLPMRQTVAVAEQAAELDVLSGGRLRLGVGVGYHRQHEALGAEWHTRSRRVEEQIALSRALWTQDSVEFDGRWHHLTDGAGGPYR